VSDFRPLSDPVLYEADADAFITKAHQQTRVGTNDLLIVCAASAIASGLFAVASAIQGLTSPSSTSTSDGSPNQRSAAESSK
jgi:hypothetical protein